MYSDGQIMNNSRQMMAHHDRTQLGYDIIHQYFDITMQKKGCEVITAVLNDDRQIGLETKTKECI